ncbi:hypothetical protein [uncultured Deinococcus sp.]|uniref:ABC transporter permease subunit n=1 Tax=uncultured Deinococcus sp. TaxID=158789 RepID=UPI00258319BD|nr:hypothetical protein [uncultured Deinococcus sp.]
MDFGAFIQNLLNGLAIGSVYAIFALGYTLVFSILGIINFAQGAVFTLGAYFTYTLVVGQFGGTGLLAGLTLFSGTSPFSGNPWSFGLATLIGAVLGGLVIGLAEAFVPADYSAYKDAVAFALLFVILLVRPQGLLGKAAIQKV